MISKWMISEEQLARWAGLGVVPGGILLPGELVQKEKWSVIACDQFSSEPEYWDDVKHLTDGEWSTLNLIIPECYLGQGGPVRQARRVHQQMDRVLHEGVLKELPGGFVLVEREIEGGVRRSGLVLAVDLESYSFVDDSRSPIRPTEGTIVERLPLRMDVRRKAGLDLPHVLLLMDDPQDRVMREVRKSVSSSVYDFHLMKGGGRVRGWSVLPADGLLSAFESLAAGGDFLFAVGDGNHSLAAAKQIWLENKARGVRPDHPARYALVEVENIHQPGVVFHPIHRVLFNVDGRDFSDFFRKNKGVSVVSVQRFSREELEGFVATGESACLEAEGFGFRAFRDRLRNVDKTAEDLGRQVLFIVQDGTGYICYQLEVETSPWRLAVEDVQPLLDDYLKQHDEVEMDYIHGVDSVLSILFSSEDAAGLILPALEKGEFFGRISQIGPYPRKSFSIGHAVEKRYYLEARRLKL